jgi:hypothetical protein
VALLNLALARLEKAALFRIIHQLMTRHTALGGDIISTDPSEYQHRAWMVAMPLGICRRFLGVCLFVAALVMTAKLVGSILENQKAEIVGALKKIVPEWRGIFMLSLKYTLAVGAVGVVMALSTSLMPISYKVAEFVASKVFVYPVTLALEGGVAWLLMPSAIRLLRPPGAESVSVQGRRWGTISMVLLSAAGLALQNIVGMAEAKVTFDSRWEFSAVSALNSIVVNAPEVLLFILLALLAGNEVLEREDNRGSKIHGLLRTLMPLHFRQSKEPE